MSDAEGLFPLPFTIRQFRLAFYAVVAAYVGFLLVTALEFKFDDRLFPYLVGVPTLLITLGHIVMLAYPDLEDRLTPDEDGDDSVLPGAIDEEDVGRSAAERQRYGLLMLAWVVVLPVLVYYLGFAYTLPPYVFAFIWFFRRDLRLAAITTVGFSLGAYLLFIVTLRMIPWGGELGLPNLFNLLPFG